MTDICHGITWKTNFCFWFSIQVGALFYTNWTRYFLSCAIQTETSSTDLIAWGMACVDEYKYTADWIANI